MPVILRVKESQRWGEELFFSAGFALGALLLLLGVVLATPKWWKVDSKLIFTELEGLSAVDSLHVWAAAGVTSQVTQSTDGGWNWMQTSSGYPYYISFVDTLRGWGVNPDYIVRTTDRGQNWVIQNNSPGMQLHDLDFIDPLHGAVVGESNFVLFTSNGGITWRKSYLPFSGASLYAVKTLDTTHIWIGGYAIPQDTSIAFFSSDWGQTWQPQPLQDIYPISRVWAIEFVDTLNGWSGLDSVDTC